MVPDFVVRNAAYSRSYVGILVIFLRPFPGVISIHIVHIHGSTVQPKIPWCCGSSAAFKGGLWPMWLQFIPEELLRYRKCLDSDSWDGSSPNPKIPKLEAKAGWVAKIDFLNVICPEWLTHMKFGWMDHFDTYATIWTNLTKSVLFLIPILEYFGTPRPR